MENLDKKLKRVERYDFGLRKNKVIQKLFKKQESNFKIYGEETLKT